MCMKGLEISKNFYNEYGKEMLHSEFSNIEDKLAIGLIGSGSECFGYDDEISIDHDFDPGFCIFISDDINDEVKFKLERAYAKLPREYMGFIREIMSPVGGNRRGVKRISDFVKEKTGTTDANLSVYEWISIPEESLAEFTNGEIWRDDSKVLTNLRTKLSTLPEDIKLKKLAGELLIMAQSGQYNYKRCIDHNEYTAAKLTLYEFANATIHATFLLNEVYMPYYKWKLRAMRDLYWPNNFKMKSELNDIAGIEDDSYRKISLEKKLDGLLTLTDDKIFNDKVAGEIELIAKIFIMRLKNDGLTEGDDNYLEKHAYNVNNKIKDVNIRNVNILAAV